LLVAGGALRAVVRRGDPAVLVLGLPRRLAADVVRGGGLRVGRGGRNGRGDPAGGHRAGHAERGGQRRDPGQAGVPRGRLVLVGHELTSPLRSRRPGHRVPWLVPVGSAGRYSGTANAPVAGIRTGYQPAGTPNRPGW